MIFQGMHCVSAQDFPDGLSLIQFLQGINKDKIPKVVKADLEFEYFSEQIGPKKAKEYFLSGQSHYTVYKDNSGLNAKIHKGDSLILYLKNEKVYESKDIDIESLLLFGIYTLDPQTCINTLENLGINTLVMDEGIRLGRPMWIIGAERRDSETPQLWIDKRYLAVKKIHYINLAQKELQQMEWDDFVFIEGIYLPSQTDFKLNPAVYFRTKRKNIEILEQVPAELIESF